MDAERGLYDTTWTGLNEMKLTTCQGLVQCREMQKR